MPPTSEVKIAGKVLYNDGTPAPGAIVRIWDEDGFGGGDDDLILTKTTGPNGEFSGAGPWKDTEGLGVPDILRLRFRVDIDGFKHAGPFIRIDAKSSAPIVVPGPPPKPVKSPSASSSRSSTSPPSTPVTSGSCTSSSRPPPRG